MYVVEAFKEIATYRGEVFTGIGPLLFKMILSHFAVSIKVLLPL